MIEINNVEVVGLEHAIRGMRNPMNSWEQSDSGYCVNKKVLCDKVAGCNEIYCIGDNDKALMQKLFKAGTDHRKFMRFVICYCDINAPLYWWKEFDTYRFGVEKNSCSTMHKLMARPVDVDDFENDGISPIALDNVIDYINGDMNLYKNTSDPETKNILWRGIIQLLPQSYRQKRTVMMSYAALRNIYRQRKGHKLNEWQQFREWIEGLPESWMITED